MKLLGLTIVALALAVSAGAQNSVTVPVKFSTPNSGGTVSGTVTVPTVAGPKGDPGTAATVTVGSTQTGDPGTPATVKNSGTDNAAVLDFVIPRGTDGTNGTNGTNGQDGAAATVAVGTTTTGAPGTAASVTNGGTSKDAVLNFIIPQGVPGATAYPGVTSCGVGCLALSGTTPGNIAIGGNAGFTGTLVPAKPTCKITVSGGVITAATGC